MFSKFFKSINNLFVSAETFNKHINHYKLISKEPALPSYAYINWGLYLINAGNKEKGLEKLNQSINKIKNILFIFYRFRTSCSNFFFQLCSVFNRC